VIGSAIRSCRKRRGLSQVALAEVTGMGRTQLSHLENGKKQPTLRTIARLAKGMKMRPSEILKQQEWMEAHNQ